MPKDENEFMAPGKAVWAPRLRLTKVSDENENGAVYVEFEPIDNSALHVWAIPDDEPIFELNAVVHPQVKLEKDKEYIAYIVPVDAIAE